MENQHSLYETLGQLTEAIKALQSGQIEMKASIRAVQETLSEARGGWRVLMWIGGSAAAAALAVNSFFGQIAAFFHRGAP